MANHSFSLKRMTNSWQVHCPSSSCACGKITKPALRLRILLTLEMKSYCQLWSRNPELSLRLLHDLIPNLYTAINGLPPFPPTYYFQSFFWIYVPSSCTSHALSTRYPGCLRGAIRFVFQWVTLSPGPLPSLHPPLCSPGGPKLRIHLWLFVWNTSSFSSLLPGNTQIR